MEKFLVGDKVNIYRCGRKIGTSHVIEITSGGNVRVENIKGLFRPDGTQREKTIYEVGRISICKS